MRTLILTLTIGLGSAGAVEPKPQVQPLLVEEGYRPAGVPARGETAWDLAEQAAYKLRKARLIFEDAKDYSAGNARPDAEWAQAEERLSRAEGIYRDTLLPALFSLHKGFVNSRAVAADVDLALMEREHFTKTGLPEGPSAAMEFNPTQDNILGLRLLREWGEGSSMHAEELLEKGLERLREGRAKERPSDANYLFDVVAEADRALERAETRTLEVAQGQARLLGKEGLYARAIEATAAYGGLDGRASFEERHRLDAVRFSNEAKKALVVNEYLMASRVEEVRTLRYLLGRFGKL